MIKAERRRQPAAAQPATAGALRVTIGGLFVALLAVLVALLAISHTLAQIGLSVPLTRPLGPNFYGWRTDQMGREIAYARNRDATDGAAFVSAGQEILAHQPLSARAMRTVAWGREQLNDGEGARAAMLAADRITRREAPVQNWLAIDAIRRGDVTATLRHYDILLRTQPRQAPAMLRQLATILSDERARRAFAPYFTPDNPWFDDLLATAVRLPGSAAPMAALLMEQRTLPDGARSREIYALLVERLARAGDAATLRALYPRLPGADRATMAAFSLDEPQFDAGYPPLTWALARQGDYGAERVAVAGPGRRVGLEVYAHVASRGVAASKLMLLGDGSHRLTWQVTARDGAEDAVAHWRVRCPGSATVIESGNLFAAPLGQVQSLPLPQGCRTARVEIQVNGGSVQAESLLTLTDLALVGA